MDMVIHTTDFVKPVVAYLLDRKLAQPISNVRDYLLNMWHEMVSLNLYIKSIVRDSVNMFTI